MDILENQIQILLNNGFVLKHQYNKVERSFKNKNIYLDIGRENFNLTIFNETKSYSYWHFNEVFTDCELKNLIFFSNLNTSDKTYFRKKLDYYYKSTFKKNILEDILNIHKMFDKIEKNIYYTEIAKNGFFKRKQLYESFCNKYKE
ncbi:hypothetical protein [Flavobacterium sp.]|uniref:hypothetical protein n=1 Tax=Flavobacterium sp. TaxID=239 RepID=UPI00286D2FB8|nr:hypothetical protein [Flavobacterium sp.]